jgi:hypothetical protein
MPDNPEVAEEDDEVEYWNPKDVPKHLTPLERAVICSRNVRAWCEWLVESDGTPPKQGELTDVGSEGGT